MAEERGQAVDIDGYGRAMAEHREISRAARARPHSAPPTSHAAGRAASSSATSGRTSCTAIVALEVLGDGTFLAKLEQSPFYQRAAVRSATRASSSTTETGVRAELVEAHRIGDDQVLTSAAKGFAQATRARRRPVARPVSDDGEPHGDAPPARGAPRDPRRAREPGGLRRSSGQAPLRLHARPGADARRSGSEVEQRVNEKVFENLPVRAFVTTDRGGAHARRDDALRREVRRRRPRRRDRGLLARALRRHARALDRGDRTVRDPLRGLRRAGRAGSRR